jgi:acetyltransferase
MFSSTDPAGDALAAALFAPRGIAVIGASRRAGSVGRAIIDNIVAAHPSMPVYAVNPTALALDGAHWCAGIADLPANGIDLAVIAIPAPQVAESLAQLGERGVRVAVVITAGLGIDTPPGRAMLAAARAHGMRIIGPNCLGVLVPRARINASFAHIDALPGGMALVSQSGALTTAMLDWAAARNIGMSAAISVGDMADTGFADFMTLFAADTATRAILLYIEGVTDGRAFLAAAAAAARAKPVIAIKAGRSAAAARAARSHTGALAGAFDVYHAALAHAGVIVVDSLEALFDAAWVLTQPPPLAGDALAIITNGGGAAVLAVDAMAAQPGTLATLGAATLAALDPVMPAAWSRANPVDIIGDAHPNRYGAAIAAMLRDPAVDALLVINCPTALADSAAVAAQVVASVTAATAAGFAKPVIACWLGDINAGRARPILVQGGLTLFTTPEAAIAAFAALVRARRGAARALPIAAQPLAVAAPAKPDDLAAARRVIAQARSDGRTRLSEIEAKALLAAFRIPVVPTRLAATAADIASAAAGLEPPLVVKIVSPDISHKSDFGGVALGLSDAKAATAAAMAMGERLSANFPSARLRGFAIQPMIRRAGANEVFAGLATDPVFGPVILFGAGGKAIEVIRDRSIALPPLAHADALAMIGETRIARLLAGYRDVQAANRDAVAGVLVALSRLAMTLPEISEIDINPLLADAAGVIALDARILLGNAPECADTAPPR